MKIMAELQVKLTAAEAESVRLHHELSGVRAQLREAEAQRRAEALVAKGLEYIDVGTSGGVFGAQNGFRNPGWSRFPLVSSLGREVIGQRDGIGIERLHRLDFADATPAAAAWETDIPNPSISDAETNRSAAENSGSSTSSRPLFRQ